MKNNLYFALFTPSFIQIRKGRSVADDDDEASGDGDARRGEWTDPAAWVKANPALASIKKIDDLTAKVERAKQNRNELSGVLCKEFNVRETVKTAWLSFDDINSESTFDLEAFRGGYCIGGVDLSITTDLTCASLLFMRRGHLS